MRRTRLPVIGAGALGVLLALAAPVSAETGGSPDTKSAAPVSMGEPPKPPARPEAPTPPPATPVAPSAQPGAAPLSEAPYAVRLADLEKRVEERKASFRRRQTRDALARDSASHGGFGSRFTVHFDSALSRLFVVTGVHCVLDGAVQYDKTDPTGALGDPAGIPMFNGALPPGDHVVQVVIELQGSVLGPFSYLRGYRFQVRSTYAFTALDGKMVDIEASAQESGNLITPFEQRPAVRYTAKFAPDPYRGPTLLVL